MFKDKTKIIDWLKGGFNMSATDQVGAERVITNGYIHDLKDKKGQRRIAIQNHKRKTKPKCKLVKILENFQSDKWRKLGKSKKRANIQKLSNRLNQCLGVKNPYSIEFIYRENPLFDRYGGDNDGRRHVIRTNEANYDDPLYVVDNIAHEVRHTYQRERADLPDKNQTEEDRRWETNMDDYIQSSEGYFAYRYQPIEDDAWRYGDRIQKLGRDIDDNKLIRPEWCFRKDC